MMLHGTINNGRQALTRDIQSILARVSWESSYRHPTTDRRIRVWVPKDANGNITREAFTLDKGFVITLFEGFTDEGVITDSYGGGLVTVPFERIPIEDLLHLRLWLERRFGSAGN